jgi:hypothetical protein
MASEDSRNRDGFRRSQWVSFEEWNDALAEVRKGPHRPSAHVVPVVVVPAVHTDPTASEEPLQIAQDMRTGRRLDDRELGLDLPTQFRAPLPEDRNGEAALAVDEPDDPLLETWPFLLIDRTGHVVTSPPTLGTGYDDFGSAGYSVFPANSQLQLRDHSRSGQIRGDVPRDFLP